LLTHLQRPKVQECLDRGSPYWFFRYREDQQLPDGSVKTTRKRHILAPSQGRYALSKRQAETARDRFLAGLQVPPAPLAASTARVSSSPAPATDLSFGQLAVVWRRDFVEGQGGGRALVAASTRAKYIRHLQNHILPRWRDTLVAKRTALQISEEAASLGAQLRASSILDVSTVSLSALKSNLDQSLELYADVILHPSFPESDFLRQQKQQIAAIQREKVTPVPMALRVFPGLLYGPQHAYGNPLTGSGTEASVSKLTREDLAKFHETWFKPNHATLIVVGDTTLSELTPKLEKLLDGWKRGDVPAKNISKVEYRPKPVVYLLDRITGGARATAGAAEDQRRKSTRGSWNL
jgi:hypothetical protein